MFVWFTQNNISSCWLDKHSENYEFFLLWKNYFTFPAKWKGMFSLGSTHKKDFFFHSSTHEKKCFTYEKNVLTRLDTLNFSFLGSTREKILLFTPHHMKWKVIPVKKCFHLVRHLKKMFFHLAQHMKTSFFFTNLDT